MEQPKFHIGQQVKFIHDHDRMTGTVLSFSYHSDTGFVYTISARYYDSERNEMAEGQKLCREAEVVDMSGYQGPTGDVKPDKVVAIADQIQAA